MLSPTEMSRSYIQALEACDTSAVHLDEMQRKETFARISELFSRMSVEKVQRLVRTLYAPGAYLNDCLTVVVGAEAIEAYFVRSVAAARQIHFDFNDIALSIDGHDYYVRWQMTLEKRFLGRGLPLRIPGVSHFRFDARGRILVHRDFWNTGSALYERIPLLGWLIRRIRKRI
jgi:hypothetical protein